MNAFKGRVAIITGASSGVGRAIALGLAAEGASLCLLGRDVARLEAVTALAQKTGEEVRYFPVDLAVNERLQELCQDLLRHFPSIDVLVHGAGTITLGRTEDSAVGWFDHQYQVNVRAPYVLTQQLLPSLKFRHGQIVFINSSAGVQARGYIGQYAATKHALKAVADSLREEVNQEGMRVLSVFLGRTATPMQAGLHRLEGKVYEPERLIQPGDVAAVVINALNLPPTAEVTDISIRPLMKPRRKE